MLAAVDALGAVKACDQSGELHRPDSRVMRRFKTPFCARSAAHIRRTRKGRGYDENSSSQIPGLTIANRFSSRYGGLTCFGGPTGDDFGLIFHGFSP
jgi:hypothetical protein